MFIVGSLFGLAGYWVSWYAGSLLRGPAGLGFVDLILPSRASKVDAWLSAGRSGPTSTGAGAFGGEPPPASGAPEGNLPGGAGGIVGPHGGVGGQQGPGTPGQNYIAT